MKVCFYTRVRHECFIVNTSLMRPSNVVVFRSFATFWVGTQHTVIYFCNMSCKIKNDMKLRNLELWTDLYQHAVPNGHAAAICLKKKSHFHNVRANDPQTHAEVNALKGIVWEKKHLRCHSGTMECT
jgi:hypothetical protein